MSCLGLSRSIPRALGALAAVLLLSCATRREGTLSFSEEDRARHDRYWKQYLDEDPAWPATRASWLAEGSGSGGVLVQTVLRELVFAYDRSDLVRHQRARTELVALAPTSIPYLVEALVPAEDVIRKQLSEVIALIGARAVPELVAKLHHPDPEVRRVVVLTLGEIGDPSSGEELASLLRTEKEWRVRADLPAAVLSTLGPEGVVPPLADALRDDQDSYVRRRIAGALAASGRAEAVAPIVGALRRASSRMAGFPREAAGAREEEWIGLEREVQTCCQALDRLTGLGYGHDVRRWMTWWEGRG